MASTATDKDFLLRIILQFLHEAKYNETLHSLEKESGVFFDMEHFEKAFINGEFDEAEKYLSGFTTVNKDAYSTKLFFMIRQLKYYEALDRGDKALALEMLNTDLEVFAKTHPVLYRDMTLLLTSPKIRDNAALKTFGDFNSWRAHTLRLVKQILYIYPCLKDKLQFPSFEKSMLLKLVTSSPEFVWMLTEYIEPSQLCSLRLPDNTLASRIMKLMYTSSGSALLALCSNAVHKLWKWEADPSVMGEEAGTNVKPELWTPPSGIFMTNETIHINKEGVVPCFALSNNDSYVISASGGSISLYNMKNFKIMLIFKTPPPAATSVVFHPKDNNVIAIGMDDSTIQIFHVPSGELISKLEGHQKRITGLAFSSVLDILISSGSDTMLCVWGIYGWEKRTSKLLHMPADRASSSNSDTRVQFHKDQLSVLAVHETQLAVYEATELKVIKQWFPPRDSIRVITDATYSSDSRSIYVSFKDGWVAVLISNSLMVRCIINPSAYLPSAHLPSDPSSRVYPVALAAHPNEPNRFAIGLTDGGVHILEPLASEAKWRTLLPENDADDAT